MITNVGVIGAGGVGGYFGAKLCQLQDRQGKVKVNFIARGKHLEAIQREGLLVKTQEGPERRCKPHFISDRIEDLPPLDLCLICVKEFDLNPVLAQLRKVAHERTIMIPLLNGVNSHTRIRKVIKTGLVFPACVYIGTHIEMPGVVSQNGGACKIFFGPDPDHTSDAFRGVLDAFAAAGIKCEWKATVERDIWEKFIFIAGYGLVTASYNKSVGEVLGDDGLKKQVANVMTEAVTIARKLDVLLPEDIVALSLGKGSHFPYETKTSFQRDFEQMNKPDERQLFAGSILEIGKHLNVATPQTFELSQLLNSKKPMFWN